MRGRVATRRSVAWRARGGVAPYVTRSCGCFWRNAVDIVATMVVNGNCKSSYSKSQATRGAAPPPIPAHTPGSKAAPRGRGGPHPKHFMFHRVSPWQHLGCCVPAFERVFVLEVEDMATVRTRVRPFRRPICFIICASKKKTKKREGHRKAKRREANNHKFLF